MTAGPKIIVPVDLWNPGQFFACCGLLELANRMWPRADVHGRFGPKMFTVEADEAPCSLPTLLAEFAGAGLDVVDTKDHASRLRLLAPFNLRLDWWRKAGEGVDLGGAPLRTWAGQQDGPTIFRLMKQATASAAALDSPFDYSEAVYDGKNGKARGKTISPFYFDSRREGTSLDLGFSPDEQSMSVLSYPVVEALALVGLQRFRPYRDEGTEPKSFVYTAWAEALPTAVAGAVVCGAVGVRLCSRFRFTKPSRGGEYVTMFSRAMRERSKDV